MPFVSSLYSKTVFGIGFKTNAVEQSLCVGVVDVDIADGDYIYSSVKVLS